MGTLGGAPGATQAPAPSPAGESAGGGSNKMQHSDALFICVFPDKQNGLFWFWVPGRGRGQRARRQRLRARRHGRCPLPAIPGGWVVTVGVNAHPSLPTRALGTSFGAQTGIPATQHRAPVGGHAGSSLCRAGTASAPGGGAPTGRGTSANPWNPLQGQCGQPVAQPPCGRAQSPFPAARGLPAQHMTVIRVTGS